MRISESVSLLAMTMLQVKIITSSIKVRVVASTKLTKVLVASKKMTKVPVKGQSI